MIFKNTRLGILKLFLCAVAGLMASSLYAPFYKVDIYHKQVTLPNGQVRNQYRINCFDAHIDYADGRLRKKQQNCLIDVLKKLQAQGKSVGTVVEDMRNYQGSNDEIASTIRTENQELRNEVQTEPENKFKQGGSLELFTELCQTHCIPCTNVEFRQGFDLGSYDPQELLEKPRRILQKNIKFYKAYPAFYCQLKRLLDNHESIEVRDIHTKHLLSMMLDALIVNQLLLHEQAGTEYVVLAAGGAHLMDIERLGDIKYWKKYEYTKVASLVIPNEKISLSLLVKQSENLDIGQFLRTHIPDLANPVSTVKKSFKKKKLYFKKKSVATKKKSKKRQKKALVKKKKLAHAGILSTLYTYKKIAGNCR